VHFWMSTIGTVLYIASMWVNGIAQGLMWRAFNTDGSLTYSFAESVEASYPGYFVRFVGGFIFFCGMLLMAYNTWRTIYNRTPQAPYNNTPQAQGASSEELDRSLSTSESSNQGGSVNV
jgi:cytochrome c oxidase cbb3-type subunit I